MASALTKPRLPRGSSVSPIPGTERVTVVHVVPEYRQALVHTAEGFEYAVTPRTPGVDLAELRVGQQLDCELSSPPVRVLRAHTVPEA
jgi:hypothetical protein